MGEMEMIFGRAPSYHRLHLVDNYGGGLRLPLIPPIAFSAVKNSI